MRKERDGESTRELVITTAREVFAERGFAGTSLAVISERCGISSGLILHHFKSKENLYKAVLEALAGEYYQAIAGTVHSSGQPEAGMQTMLSAAFKYWSEDSTYFKISSWAYLENRTELIEAEIKLTLDLSAQIQKMQAENKFDPQFSPFVLLSISIGPIHFWMQHQELFKEALNLNQTNDELNELFLQQYLNLIKKVYSPA
jgi:AcrR family transcriptional regulator